MPEAEGATPATVVNHPFTPEADWWTQCVHCGLSEAAHFTTVLCIVCGGQGVMRGRDRDGNYDPCDPCEGTGITTETNLTPGWCATPALIQMEEERKREGGL